jgi:long-chain acyl-CoA synthetase
MATDLISADQAGTLYGLLRERARRSPDRAAYTEFDPVARRWTTLSWSDALARAQSLAAALAHRRLSPGDRVAVLLPNGIDWVAFDMAAHALGLVLTPLYVQDSPGNAAYMLDDSGARVLLIDSAARWRRIEPHLSGGALDEVWIRDPGAGEDGAGSDAAGSGGAGSGGAGSGGAGAQPRRLSLAQALATRADDWRAAPCAPDDLATIIYTSGTTGAPKGVMLTHRALLQNAEAVTRVIPPLPDDVLLSVLPLAHAFERTMGYHLPMMGGASVAFSRSLLRLREDFQVIAPTALIGVPRLYQKIWSGALQAKGPDTRAGRLLRRAAAIGWKRRAGLRRSVAERLAWPFLEALVARKFARAFGGRLRVAVSGGAALPVDVAQPLLGLGLPLVEGYGLTEAAPVLTASTLAAYEPGAVGFALPGVALRLGEGGELLALSPSRMLGYWRDEAATAAAFADGGWLRTGDVAELRDGRVAIVGRARDTLVLTNGENVNPAPVEARIGADPLVDAVCVVGHGRPFLAAILSLNGEAWRGWARASGLDPETPNAPEANRLLMRRLTDALTDLAPFQRVRALHADTAAWSIEDGLVTPTLKVRKARVEAAYATEIERLYARAGTGR